MITEHKLICYLRIQLQLLRPQCPTLQKRKYQNHSMEKKSRIAGNKLPHPKLTRKTVDSASDVNSQATLRKTAPNYPTVLNVELEATSQQSVLPNNRTTDSKMKDVKMLTKDVKLAKRTGRNHKTDPSSLKHPTNASIVQTTTEHVIVQ